ncbi:1-acyl-sn-glycerol-3-phosphate acyltransferase alpha-like [Catharus ustulatus]|uniref:1-acyl-sn-glycerol-3-phosphate acyltransferase alpha-like n=1 Tax=Catharus ustulatus TaxID=91951 RepID=UPI0014088ACF|nr:1-acyl-sn-glycerol-3-phosphate acyltransferase alpha-like [Catharus ustulatus]
MDVLLLHGLLLLPLAALLLYRCSPPFQYLCKVAFFNCWIVALATVLSPFAAFRGRSVENMKLLRAALLPLKRLYGIRMRVRGSEQLQLQGPFVIVCNHQASLDLMGMVEVIPERCVPIAKRELLYLGTVGWACWLSGIIFIDRHRRDAAIEVISHTASTMRRENLRVWVFPEGTRNPGKSMLPFKRGAFHLAVQAQVPIVPIVISPYWDFFSSKEKRFSSGTCTIRVLPRVETRGLSPKDVPELTESVRQAMAEALAEMSMSDHGDQDMEQPLLGPGKDSGSPQGQGDTAGNSK